MKKITRLIIFVILMPIIAVAANPDSAIIRIVPVDKPHTNWAIITDSPATLEINVTNEPHSPTYEVWLLFIIDEATYNTLNTITITGTEGPTTLNKASFTGGPVNSGKIPEASDSHWAGPHAYPGSAVPTNNYQVSAILSQMSQIYPTTSIRYVLAYGFHNITTSPKYFTIDVDSSHINILILAQGRLTNSGVLTENSPFSGSSLIVFEPGPILLALASFSAFALYAFKRRKVIHLK